MTIPGLLAPAALPTAPSDTVLPLVSSDLVISPFDLCDSDGGEVFTSGSVKLNDIFSDSSMSTAFTKSKNAYCATSKTAM